MFTVGERAHDRAEQLGGAHGFGEERVPADRARAPRGERITADEDDGNVRRLRVCFQLLHSGDTVEYRQGDVHEDQVRLMLASLLDAIRPVARLQHVEPGTGQHAAPDLPDLGCIFHNENRTFSHVSQKCNPCDVKRHERTLSHAIKHSFDAELLKEKKISVETRGEMVGMAGFEPTAP